MWSDKMETASGKLIEANLVGNIYDKNRDKEIKEANKKRKEGGAD
jgi:hypothetical protein